MRNKLGIIIIIASWAAGVYFGLWLMFIKPIIDCATSWDNGTFTATILAITVIKCILASTLGSLVIYTGTAIGLKTMK